MESRNISFSFTNRISLVKSDLRRASELEEVDQVLLEVLHVAHWLLGFGLLGLLGLLSGLLLFILLLLKIIDGEIVSLLSDKKRDL